MTSVVGLSLAKIYFVMLGRVFYYCSFIFGIWVVGGIGGPELHGQDPRASDSHRTGKAFLWSMYGC